MFEIYETKTRITDDNDAHAAELRSELESKNVFFINLMGSPGAGKTSTLIRTINALKDEFSIGVMEADMDSDVDAQTISQLGVRVIQLHTGGSCHMDADMTKRGLDRMTVEGLDVVFLENVGNLVCPAEFDVGAALKVMILSAPEGDDKPLKYPLMFKVSNVMLENKIETKDVFDYDPEKAEERARALNPDIIAFRVSAKTGEGFDEWTSWLKEQIRTWRSER
ncbi:MAG: hydrogenase nickel incorporation protein HypB [Solobacterium sp.]|nr:hydrogenase nickel incorporation protein HypB [Solobacterium sp.]